jgi:hypothetical protein
MKVTKIRAGLYGVDAGNGKVFLVENRQAPGNGYGHGWLWYITEAEGDRWYDPTHTKAEALEVITKQTSVATDQLTYPLH